jgi:clan AA aspartic protease (TIGR02281 family)
MGILSNKSANILYQDTRPGWRIPGFTALLVVGLATAFVVDGDLRRLAVEGMHPVAARPVPSPVAMKPAESPPVVKPRGEIRITANEHSQFWISGSVNGIPVRWLIDTGSSDVAVPKRLARQLGLRGLKYTALHSTANGPTYDAPTHLKKLEMAGITASDFPADVSGGKLDICLLGTTWLSRFDYSVSNGVMVLIPKEG